ncbi:MAG: mandelate racemase/muconate lactonizing enzyme family protein [Acidobacteria bacterium]|nr:mandelate racemase/muconate lactonizing enzyme family protein [Acidobacteriota bacterium]
MQRRTQLKVQEVRAYGLRGRTPEGGWANELRPEDCVHTIIAVLTEDGIGWGSVFTSEALVKASLEILRPLLIGENALEPERVSEKLHQHTFWLGRGGSITHTISGIDIALWDLLGKACGQPVGRLIGGRYRERVRPYASLLMRQPEQMADELLPVKAQGFRAFKIGWGPFGRKSNAIDEAIVRAAREAVGEESLLMVDAGGSDAYWPGDYKWAIRAAEMLAEYGVYWFEEALHPDALAGYVALRRASRVPITGGEVFTRRQSFAPWLTAGAFDIVQPDVTKCGGLSEQRRIAQMAVDNGVGFIPHGWNTTVGLASDLQIASAFPGTDLVEYLTGSPFIDDLCAAGWKLDADGMLPIPYTPGLGIDLNLDALAEFARADVTELRR